MPLEMRPRRPLFADTSAAGGPPAIASSGGAVATPPGGMPGAVNPGSKPATALASGPPKSPLDKGAQAGAGVLGGGGLGLRNTGAGGVGAGAAGGTGGALGGQRETTVGNVGLGGAIGQRNQANASNYGQLGGPQAHNTTNLGGAPLSRGTGGGGKARTTGKADYNNPEDARQVSMQLGRPEGSSLPPLGGSAPRVPGAVSGPGAQPRGGPAGGIQTERPAAGSGAQGRGEEYDDWGNLQPPVGSTMSDQDMRSTIGLYSRTDGSFQGQRVGSTQEGYGIFRAANGTFWAETPQGWRRESGAGTSQAAPTQGTGQFSALSDTELADQIARLQASMLTMNPAARASMQTQLDAMVAEQQQRHTAAGRRENENASKYGSTSAGLTGGSGSGGDGGGSGGGQARRYSNAGAFGTTSSALSSGGGSSGSAAPARGGQSADQGYSQEAGAKAEEVGIDPFLVQALLDMGVSLDDITSEGVSSVEDPDFGISGSAEWNDADDDEAGVLYRANKKAQENKAKWRVDQAQGNMDARIEQLLARLNGSEFAPAGISDAAVNRLVEAQRNRLLEGQSRTLGSQLQGMAAAGLSPEAQQAAGTATSTQYGLAGAEQEAQTRYNAEMANMQGRMQQYSARIGMLQQLLAGPAAQASAQLQAQIAQQMSEIQAAAQREMQTWQTNQVTGWDFLRDMGGSILGAGTNIGSYAAGTALGNWLNPPKVSRRW